MPTGLMFSKFQVWTQKTLPSLPERTISTAFWKCSAERCWVPTATILLVLPRGLDHRLALGDVVADRLLDVHVLARLAGVDRRQGVPVVGRGDDHGVDVLGVEHLAVVAHGRRLVAPRLLDPVGGLRGVTVVDVGDARRSRRPAVPGTCRGAGCPGSRPRSGRALPDRPRRRPLAPGSSRRPRRWPRPQRSRRSGGE